jgi:hypothetical protein
VAIGPTCTDTCVPVVGRLSGGGSHGRNGQSNQGWCHFHFHRFILVEFAVLWAYCALFVIPVTDDIHVRPPWRITDGLNKKWMETWILMKLFLHGQLTGPEHF